MGKYKYIEQFAKENSIEYTATEEEKFNIYIEFLLEQNKSLNLTAITDKEEVEIKHMVDSIASAPLIKETIRQKEKREAVNEAAGIKIIDIGTGAGFPGIPLKIVLPEADIVLADSLNKRVRFLEDAIARTRLKSIKAIAGRAEELSKAKEPLREAFDICVSRAVADMAVLSEYALPFVKVGGYACLYKGANCEDEIRNAEKAISELGGRLSEIKKYSLPNNSGERCLVIIQKEKAAPDKYPRRPGKPSKSPIK